MKSASVYQRRDGTYFHSSSQTTAGVWIATAPFLKVELGRKQTALGEAALVVLNASQESIPHPKPEKWSGIFAPMLELAGVKSWATFMSNAACLSLEAESGRLKIIPKRNLGPKEGFESVPENAVELLLESSPDQIGTAIEEALTRCQ